ncbi:MAG: MBL fold metallo-hydrolase [Acholeplasmatales bacterium]|nr:MBL fold metallo-hydrolase [Acholeplasmatales bacterium]
MKKFKKIICSIMCFFSVAALASCSLDELFGQAQKIFVDINYYVDGTLVDFVTVLKGQKAVLELDEIFVYQEDTTLDKYIEARLGENQEFDYWYTDAQYQNKATADLVVLEELDLYGKIVTKQSPNPNPNPNPTPNPGDGAIVETVIYDELQLHFLELGNEYAGDCTYIKAGDTDILIDAGSRKGSATTIKQYVDQYCTDGKLEYVIATHAHQDHIAAFVGNSSGGKRTGILYEYEVGTIIDFSLTEATSQIYEDYLTAVEKCVDAGAKHYTADQCWEQTDGASRSFVLAEGITLNILYNKYYFEEAPDENDYSVCTMISYNDKHFMLTGDLEHEGEMEMAKYYDGSTPEKTLPHCVLFKAGHHGSASSSNEELLSKITPEIVTVCACAGSTEYTANYQTIFPTQAMIDRVAKYTDRVYVTSMFNETTKEFESLNGNIIISSNGSNIGVSATNNITKLKDSAWFNETVYVVYSGAVGNITSGKGKEDFFTASTPNAVAVPRRVWPTV